MLRSRAAEIGLTNLTVIQSPWDEADAPSADVALCSLVLHHVPDAAPFVSKLQEHATDRVVVVEMMETPGALEIPFYERVHGSAPTPLPGLPDVLRLLWAMDIHPDVAMLTAETAVLDTDRDAAMEQLRRRLGVEEGTEADARLARRRGRALGEHAGGLHGQGRVAETDGDGHLDPGAQRRVTMPRNDDVTGIVLAGGAGRRMRTGIREMGAPKPLLQLGGKTLVEHVVAAIEPLVSGVIVVTNDAEAMAFLGLPTVGRRRARSRSTHGPLQRPPSPVRRRTPSPSPATPRSSRPRSSRRSSHDADPTP